MKLIKKIISWPLFAIGLALLALRFIIFGASEKLDPMVDANDYDL